MVSSLILANTRLCFPVVFTAQLAFMNLLIFFAHLIKYSSYIFTHFSERYKGEEEGFGLKPKAEVQPH